MYAVINIAYRGLCMQIVGQMPLLFVSENHVYIAVLTRASKPPTRWLYEYHEASQETHLSPMHSPTHQRHPWLLKSNYIHLQLWRCENVPKKSPCLERTQSTPSTKHSIIQHLLLLSGSHASSISPVAFITTAHTTHRDDFFSVCSFAWTLPDIDWKGVRLTHRLWLATDGVCPFDNWQFIKISSFVSRLVAAGGCAQSPRRQRRPTQPENLWLRFVEAGNVLSHATLVPCGSNKLIKCTRWVLFVLLTSVLLTWRVAATPKATTPTTTVRMVSHGTGDDKSCNNLDGSDSVALAAPDNEDGQWIQAESETRQQWNGDNGSLWRLPRNMIYYNAMCSS